MRRPKIEVSSRGNLVCSLCHFRPPVKTELGSADRASSLPVQLNRAYNPIAATNLVNLGSFRKFSKYGITLM